MIYETQYCSTHRKHMLHNIAIIYIERRSLVTYRLIDKQNNTVSLLE